MSDKYAIDGQKLHYHLDRIQQWQLSPLDTFPIYIEISPVGHCNHRCTFCAVDYIGYKTRRLEQNVLCATISNMAQNGVRSIMYAGEGEPLLHPDIGNIINHTYLHHIDVGITTNGTPLTAKLVDQSLHHVTWIKVSINGGPKSYARIHQTKQTDYDRAFDNISYAISKRESKTAIGVQTVLLPDNADDLLDIVNRARDTGVDYMVIKPYSQHHSSITTKYRDVTYQPYQDLLTRASELSNDRFEVIVRSKSMASWDSGTHDYDKCYSTPTFWAYVMATGDVYSCSAYLLNEEFRLGNINTKSFSEIWLGDRRKAHLKAMASLDISKCRLNCRMNHVNKFLYAIKHPGPHKNFI